MAVFVVQEGCLGCAFWYKLCGKIHNCKWLSDSELRVGGNGCAVGANGTV